MFSNDVESRLRLVRFGMVINVAVAFAVWSAYGLYANAGALVPAIIGSLIATAVIAVIMVAIYFGYAAIIKRGGNS